ncbi:MAG: hypothetical protein MZU97_02295 [Bacillus subtilis]|nr:hypothetical protein [Bacillus subtilis]
MEALGAVAYIHLIVKVINLRFGEVYKTLAPPLIGSAIMTLTIYIVKLILRELSVSNSLILLINIPLGVLVYYITMRLLFTGTFDFIKDNITKALNINKSKAADNKLQET